MMPAILVMKNCLFSMKHTRGAVPSDNVKVGMNWRLMVAVCAAVVLAPALSHADPYDELAALSSISKDKIDRSKLEKGGIISARSPGVNLQRGQCVEAIFVVEAPVEKTLESLKEWNVTAHPDLKVYLHGDLPASFGPGDFSKLASAPGNGAVKSFITASQKLGSGSTDLQLNTAEAEQAPKKVEGRLMSPELVSFWSGVLDKRAKAFASGGTPAQPPYNLSGQKVSASEDLSSLLKSQPKAHNQFRSLIESAGVSGKPSKPNMYWELFDAEGDAHLSLGASFFLSSGKTAQAAEIGYFATGGDYATLTLYQMWPIEAGGKPATLIWRVDFVSAAGLANLHGIERNASGSAMVKEFEKFDSAFQKDAAH